MKINKQRNSWTKKRILIVLVGLLVILACYALVAWINRWFPFVSTLNGTYEPGTQFINMKRTNTEKQSSDNLKKNPREKTQNTQTDTPTAPSVDSTTGKKQANVLITNAGVFNGTVSASGFATNIVESGGSCTYTFTNGSLKVTKVVETLPNATSTTCSTTSFPASELQSGTWSVVLSYSSSQSSGVSAAKEFQR